MKVETKTILSWSYNRNLIQTNFVNITQIQQECKLYKNINKIAIWR